MPIWGLVLLVGFCYLVVGVGTALVIEASHRDNKDLNDSDTLGLTDAQAGGVIMLWPLFWLKFIVKAAAVLPRAMVRGVKAGTGLWVKL